LERLKIFPLPTAVLLPGSVLPLHIFEPRYRKMVTDALAKDRVIAMSMLDSGWEADYHGRPRVRPICGVGRIMTDERLADGRFNIQLVGLCRAEIIEEFPPNEPYREVRARLASEQTADPGGAESLRNALLSLCTLLPGDASEALAKAASSLKEPGDLADLCAAALSSEAPVRQKVLEALDVHSRVRLALDVVSEALLRLRNDRSEPGDIN
jgi:Lon protease-like protein